MKQNDFYELDGCTDFIPVKLIEERKHMTNPLKVELTETGHRTFVPHIYSFPKVNKPQKPVVPKFVADFYESIKDDFENKVYDLCLKFNRDICELSGEVWEWFDCGENEPIQTLVKMELYGYEIEQEKLYTVEIPNPNIIGNEHTVLVKNGYKEIVMVRVYGNNWRTAKGYHLTESEIRKDFDWAWQRAKEVEETDE